MIAAERQAAARDLPAPRTLEQVGLSRDLLTQLILKMLHLSGELTGSALARGLGLPFHVIEPVVDSIKQQQQIDIAGGALGRQSYVYRITDAGRTRAILFLQHSHYVGIAPVPLAQYQHYMAAFGASKQLQVTRADVAQAFSHLVISQRVLDQLGPAVNAGQAMFVYGPPGNGKTVMSQAIHNLLEGDILIPHAIEVGGSIIRFFDQVNHQPVEQLADEGIDLGAGSDRRWIRCRRPKVMVGGELTLDQLELSYSPTLGFYRAPLQALANGGLLLIDDFGRQSCSPRELLNRWIVPLESRVDFLTLQTGQKFDLPFMTMIVFATNIRPAELVDEAFLRRVHYKVFAENPSRAEFLQIFELCCEQYGLEYQADVVQKLLTTYFMPRAIQLRGCQPRDLVRQVISLAEYLDQPPALTTELLEAACAAYFIDDREGQTSYV